uniref:Uncharacterized protein n=1 Tax=Heterorhabditis bacteriophora TaxID=37862 RepID=A0A1I7X0R1_HETBA
MVQIAVLQPTCLPIDRPVTDYLNDTPITNMGEILARLVGRSIFISGYCPGKVFATNAYYAVHHTDRIEPGLFENVSLYPNGPPILATPSQRSSFPVDDQYRSLMNFGDNNRGWYPNLYAIPPVNYENFTTQFKYEFLFRRRN